MKKIFTLITAIMFTLIASADTVWDFTVLPTQVCDGTGNLSANMTDGKISDDPNKWSAFDNIAGLTDGSELSVKAGEVFEPTKGLIWSAMDSKQTVNFRNWPEEYCGMHLHINKAAEVMIPAKAGQVIELVLATSKNGGTTKKITSSDVVETFDNDGVATGGIKIEFAEKAVYSTYTLTAKVDNPYLAFETTIAIQKIEVKNATGIEAVKNTVKNNGNNMMFNLAGQRIAEPVKGQIYIMNGKKYIGK